jgi:hypothetical protein
MAGDDANVAAPGEWVESARQAFALLENAPDHYRELLYPIVLKALSDPSLRPAIDFLVADAFSRHLLAGRAPAPFLPEPSAALGWVDKAERLPTESGVYVTMNRMIKSPCLLRFAGEANKHWAWVTHWYGPIPVYGA